MSQLLQDTRPIDVTRKSVLVRGLRLIRPAPPGERAEEPDERGYGTAVLQAQGALGPGVYGRLGFSPFGEVAEYGPVR